MRLPIVFTPAAKDEFDDAHIRYETSRKGLGRRFRTAVRDCLRYVQRFPLTKQIVHPPTSGEPSSWGSRFSSCTG
jgi:hypothetical protein